MADTAADLGLGVATELHMPELMVDRFKSVLEEVELADEIRLRTSSKYMFSCFGLRKALAVTLWVIWQNKQFWIQEWQMLNYLQTQYAASHNDFSLKGKLQVHLCVILSPETPKSRRFCHSYFA